MVVSASCGEGLRSSCIRIDGEGSNSFPLTTTLFDLLAPDSQVQRVSALLAWPLLACVGVGVSVLPFIGTI